MSEDLFEEKRDFIRMRIEAQVTYSIHHETYYGLCHNLSASGLYMTTEHALTAGDIIEIIMNPSGDRLPPFVSKGQVIQCKPNEENSDVFNVSVQLILKDA